MKRLPVLLLTLLFTQWVFAQGTISYAWQTGDIALSYPADWAVPQEINGILVLRATAGSVEGAPVITLLRAASSSTDLYTDLQSAFDEIGVIPSGPLDAELVNFSGVGTSGRSVNGSLYGIGRTARLADGTTLQIVGTVAASERDAFIVTFNAVADSISLGAASTPHISSAYGVLWQTSSADGETFTDLIGLAYGQDNTLYTIDDELGIVWLDAQTGEVLDFFRPSIVTAPSDIAVDADGSIYVADLACSCIIFLTSDGTENGTLGGFASSNRLSLVVTPNGRIVTADDDGIYINGSSVATIGSNTLLAMDANGRVLALSADGSVWELQNQTLVPLMQLSNLPPINDIAVDANDHLILATATQGVLIYDLNGQQVGQVGRVVPNFPLPGELVSPSAIVVDANGTIIWADSGTLTAMSDQVQSSVSGTGALTFGLAVGGILNEFTSQQTWTFEGVAGQIITITAISDDIESILDVAVRLLSPTGTEEAYNDSNDSGDLPQRSDAQILAHTLQNSGIYFVIVERVGGEGNYVLGVGEGVQNFELNPDEATILQGELQAVFPSQRWAFAGRAGQVFTVTMLAESGDLDSLLRLRDAGGNVLAENDDAADATLGLNAQLLQVTLPADGPYTLEAVRFAGAGRYRLVIVATS
jgi:sugar lactone lactonase YvrE